jgi:hypothetical protein
MKTKLIFTLGILFFGLSISYANPVEKKTKKGKVVTLKIVSDGPITLYTCEAEVLKTTIPEDPTASYTEIKTLYYVEIPDSEFVQELTFSNYKKVLLSQMTGKPEISKKIGTKGYKFVNVEGIFMAYNEQ